MKHLLNTFLRTIRKPYIILGILVLFGIFFFFAQNNNTAPLTAIVERGSVIQTVLATGKTKAISSVNLAFDRSGQIARIYATTGSKVVAGQVLIELERSELIANLADVEANLAVQQAKLAELKTGLSPETIALKEAAVTKAKNTLLLTQKNLNEKIEDAYTKADNAIRNYIDQLFTNPKGANPSFNLTIADSQLRNTLENTRVTIEKLLTEWEASAYTATTEIQSAANQTYTRLATIKNFLDSIAFAINTLTASGNISQAVLDGYKADVALARADINIAIGNISTAVEKFNNAEADLIIAEQEYTIAITGGTAEQIKTQEAYVKQAEAKVQAVKAQIGKTILRSPITGTLTKQEAEVGETISPYEMLVSIVGNGGLEIEAFIPEINIGKITLQNPVQITLDAFSGETFTGTVSAIDPAETIVDGVVNFKVTISFNELDNRIKSGLTANLSIETTRIDNTLFLPRFAITKTGDEISVTKIVADKTERVSIITGLEGEQSRVEIISGLSEGDLILVAPTSSL